MTLRYAVGIKIGNKADQVTVEAEDALIAALKAKTGTVRAKFCIPEMTVEPPGSRRKNRGKSMVAKYESGARAE